jgi:hypothetical protein
MRILYASTHSIFGIQEEWHAVVTFSRRSARTSFRSGLKISLTWIFGSAPPIVSLVRHQETVFFSYFFVL